MGSILDSAGPIPDEDEEEDAKLSFKPASILDSAGPIPDEDEPKTGGDPMAHDSASSTPPESSRSDDSQRIGSPKAQTTGTLDDIARDLDANPPVPPNRMSEMNVSGESPMMKRLNERGPDDTVSAGLIRGTVGIPINLMGIAGEAGQYARRGDYEGAALHALPTALALGASTFPMGRAIVGGAGALSGLGQILSARTPADVAEGGVNTLGGAAMGLGGIAEGSPDSVAAGRTILRGTRNLAADTLNGMPGPLKPLSGMMGKWMRPGDPAVPPMTEAEMSERFPSSGIRTKPGAAVSMDPVSGQLLSPEDRATISPEDLAEIKNQLELAQIRQEMQPIPDNGWRSPEEGAANPALDLASLQARLKPMRPMRPVPSVSPDVAEASPSATSHLTPKNAKEWASILTRSPADVVQPESTTPAPKSGRPLQSIVSVQQLPRLIQMLDDGQISAKTFNQMSEGVNLDDLVNSKGKGRPGSKAPIGIDQETWDANRPASRGRP